MSSRSSDGYGYPPDWDQRRRRVYKRDNYTCQNCGNQGGPYGDAELHAHHIVNVASGGSHDLTNLTTLCVDCHTATHNSGVMAPTARRGSAIASSRSGSTGSSRNGRWWVHTLLFLFTFGVGNLLYWWWCRRRHRVHHQQRQRTGESASGRGLIASSIRLVFIFGIIVLAASLLPVAVGFGIFYAGYTVATNRHDAFDRLQASEATRLPGLDQDAPDWRVGAMTTLYLLTAGVALALLLAAL